MTQPEEAATMQEIKTSCGIVKDPEPWSDTETNELRRLFAEGLDAPVIGQRLGRTRWSVWAKLGRLGLFTKPRTGHRYSDRLEPIATLVCDHFGLKVAQLRAPERTKGLAWARQVAMWVAVKAGRTYSATARYFWRDHTTALHAEKKIDRLRLNNPHVKALTDALFDAAREIAPPPPPPPAPAPKKPGRPKKPASEQASEPAGEAPEVAFYERRGGETHKNSRAFFEQQNARFAAAMLKALGGVEPC